MIEKEKIIIAVVSFLIILSLVFYYCGSKDNSSISEDEPEIVKSDNSKDSCFVSSCEKWSMQPESDLCYQEVARCLNDSSVCNNIIDQNIKSDCLVDIAVLSGDFSLCSSIGDSDDGAGWTSNCYYRVSSDLGDLEYCNGLYDAYDEYGDPVRDCMSDSNNQSIYYCKSPEEENYQQSCFMGLAVYYNDSEWCDNVSRRDECLTNLAVESGTDYCGMIEDDASKIACNQILKQMKVVSGVKNAQ